MDYELYDFLPLYNSTQSVEFDRDVNTLQEFTQYKLPKEEMFPQNPGDLMLHQKLISTFINPHTAYSGLLLVHEMGTGKTCSAVAVAEQFIKARLQSFRDGEGIAETRLNRIVVLTRGEGLQLNFINEIANVCTSGKYLSEIDKYTDEVEFKFKRLRKNVKANYEFQTFEVFAKKLSTMSSKNKAKYEDALFIVDEAHNITHNQERSTEKEDVEEELKLSTVAKRRVTERSTPPKAGRETAKPSSTNPLKKNKGVSIYAEIYGLFESLERKKILLLTGTPMKDKPIEVVDLLNLILPEKLFAADLENELEFARKVKGYVSYLRAMVSEVESVEVGEKLGDLQYLKVYPVQMSPFQSKIYRSAQRRDEEERAIFVNSRQSSSIVFPDGSYGSGGFVENVKSLGYNRFRFKQLGVENELKQNLGKYSAKYRSLVSHLLSDYDNSRASFVYSEHVKGSGLIVLGLILELFGFTKATVNTDFSKKGKRYVIFTNETSTNTQTRKLIEAFNNPKNLYGEYITTILGSRVIMEGYSFKHIQAEYIMSSHWNYESQVIARGLRLGSHNDLLRAGVIPRVSIYHFVALPDHASSSSVGSIDLYSYQIAEQKDIAIQKVVKMLKEAAFDCELNKERNMITNPKLDFTRSCEYDECNYTCVGEQNKNGKDPRNYRVLYFSNSEKFVQLRALLLNKFRSSRTQIATLEELQTVTGFERFEIYFTLMNIINSREILFTRPEGVYYLHHLNNVFYPATMSSANVEDPYLLEYYLQYSGVFVGKTIDELIYENQNKYMVELVTKIFNSSDLRILRENVADLPVYLQEQLLFHSLVSQERDKRDNFVRNMILFNFKLYYTIVPFDAKRQSALVGPLGQRVTQTNKAYTWLNQDEYKCSDDIITDKSWRKCTLEEIKEVEAFKKDKYRVKVSNNQYGYIGFENIVDNKHEFCLKKVDENNDRQQDKRSINVGKRCRNWKKQELVNLVANILKLDETREFPFGQQNVQNLLTDPNLKDIVGSPGGNRTLKDYKRIAFWNAQSVKELCDQIQITLKEKQLVVQNSNCGTSRKIRTM
jgi:hypothetical protein